MRCGIVMVLLGTLLYAFPSAGEAEDMDAEIVRLRKELKQVSAERQRNADDMGKDRVEAAAYTKRIQKRFSDMRAEIDALKTEIAAGARKRDSLTALVVFAQNQRKQIELSEDNLRKTLIDGCIRSIQTAQSLPPHASVQIVSSLQLLKSELEIKSVDNIEALNRTGQVLARIDETTRSIVVSQESSPVPEVRGTVYRLRLGTIFEGCADVKGQKAALWQGTDAQGGPRWKITENATEAGMIHKAATIREGKALPDFANLPFSSDSAKGGAQ